MAKIVITSRAEIEKMRFDQNTALISITDANWSFAVLKNEPAYTLRLAFDDVDNDIFIGIPDGEREYVAERYHMINDKQAERIAEFYKSIRDKVNVIICQCEHGQSRSAAVAAAILEYRSGSGIRVFAHDKYCPNKAVFNKVLTALKGY